LCGCYLLKHLPRTLRSNASVTRLHGLDLEVSNEFFRVAVNVTQNCGLVERRFKLKSEARWPWISQTIARLAVD
jgi:hypothetical protein